MNRAWRMFLLAVAIAALARMAAAAGDRRDEDPLPTPLIKVVEPASAKTGDIVKASGMELDKANVAELYLTNGKVDVKTDIVEQTESFIRFKIPAGLSPGKFTLMILIPRSRPVLLEEPVFIRVE